MPAEDLQDRQVLLLVAHGHLLKQEGRRIPPSRRGLAPRVRRFMVHVEHVLGLFHIMALRVNRDPTFSIDAFQVICLLALHSNRFQKSTHSLHGGSLLIQSALIVGTTASRAHILLHIKWLRRVLLWQVLMARELGLRLLLIGLVLRRSSILVKLVNVLI